MRGRIVYAELEIWRERPERAGRRNQRFHRRFQGDFAASGAGVRGRRKFCHWSVRCRWPAGAKDVAAATSWVHQNIDLFGGSRDEIVAVGYSVGAFHVASFLAHREFQERDSDVAAAILVSGIYHSSADASANEKSYFGADASKYNERSAFPGILNIETPILLAWSALDPPRLVAQGEQLKQLLCNSATHCPHTTVMKSKDGLASAFGPDASGGSLAQPTLELVREIEARGLP